MFEQIIGNQPVKEYLTRLVERCAVANSLLFAGPDGVGKSLFAQALADLLLGSAHHPDIHIYRPEGKIGMHSIDAMRQFSEEVYMAPFQGPWKVFILHDAERMLSYSANALLKTFEEPPPDTIIILLSSTPASLLPTILSRCRVLHFHAISEEEIAGLLHQRWNVPEEKAKQIAARAQGSVGQAVRLLQQGEDEIRQDLLKILTLGKFSSYKDLTDAVAAITEKVETAKKQSEDTLREVLYQGPQENLTAVQKESLQKEVDGTLAMRQVVEAQSLFDIIAGWYRDLHLIKVNGARALLTHRDSEHALEQALQRGQWLELEPMQKAITEARLALERSTSLSIVLETVFMRLNFI